MATCQLKLLSKVEKSQSNQSYLSGRLSVAPMMDWTDKHCRYFHRLLSRHALLYTEMVTTGALLHGDVPRHLRFNVEEHPLALQLGGSEPADLARAARLGEEWGYDEINLNCGCPSERVQRGAFGACLMAEPQLVADGVKAMCDVVNLPVTVKHRIGIDKGESYDFVRDFVGTVSQAGCSTFIVHARNAWLKGLSPKENREVPPLRYEMVHQLKHDFPQLNIMINGGINTPEQVHAQLQHVDGVMIGREAYHNPWWLASWDTDFFGDAVPAEVVTREHIEALMVDYMARESALYGTPWSAIARHMLGLRHGLPGSRRWRQVWSDHKLKTLPPHEVMVLAHAEFQAAA
ncbi:MAG: tRNA dihydrouridine(20/20a) synthase DusA [Polaromonas sp.]|nr:tRNA dihydrouridine(20/20a) synthase DusA [Polaromonas sp.]